MTTPAKQYQNVSYKELITYSENNPNRNRTLDSIEILSVKPSQETSLDNLGLKGYSAFNLNPTGIVAFSLVFKTLALMHYLTKGHGHRVSLI